MRATDALASATATYAIPLLVFVTTGSTALTGLAFLLEWTPRLSAFAFAGSLVDRFGASRVFRLANLARATAVGLTSGLLLVLSSTGSTTTALVLAFGALSGLLAEVSFVAVETLGAEAGRRTQRPHHVQAAQAAIDQGAALVGPLLGGALLLAGSSWLLIVVAMLAMASAVCTPEDDRPSARQATRTSLLIGWRTLRRTPPLCWLVAGLAASNLATGVLQAAAPITVIHHFHHSAASVGAVWSAAAIVSLVTVWAARKAIDRWQVWPVGASGAAIATIACMAAPLAPDFACYTAAVAVVMAAESAMTVVLRTMRARVIPPAAFGSTLAVTIILMLLPLPAAGALVALVPGDGLTGLLLACAGLQGLMLAACFTALRRHSTTTSPAPATSVPHQRDQRAPQPADPA